MNRHIGKVEEPLIESKDDIYVDELSSNYEKQYYLKQMRDRVY